VDQHEVSADGSGRREQLDQAGETEGDRSGGVRRLEPDLGTDACAAERVEIPQHPVPGASDGLVAYHEREQAPNARIATSALVPDPLGAWLAIALGTWHLDSEQAAAP